MRARTLSAVVAGFALGALAAFAVSLLASEPRLRHHGLPAAESQAGPDRAVGVRATWRAPGRVNLIGDHTDYSGGLVLPLAIDLGTTVRLTSRSTGRFTAHSTLLPDESVDVPLVALDAVPYRWARYVAGAVHLLSDDGVVVEGVEVRVDSDLPVGAGLSSSAALVCATLGALLDATGRRWDRQRIALAAQRVENEYLGAPVGVMDPTVVMHARAAHALLLDARTMAREQIPVPLVPPGAPEGCSCSWSTPTRRTPPATTRMPSV